MPARHLAASTGLDSQGPLFFFFNATATPDIYTLSLHDALPIFVLSAGHASMLLYSMLHLTGGKAVDPEDRKSTRLNSSHSSISYAVFCLKKKNKTKNAFYYQNKKKFKNI